MSNVYLSNGKLYRVKDENVQSFLEQNPNAEKRDQSGSQFTIYYGEDNKRFRVKQEDREAFKKQNPNFYSEEEIEAQRKKYEEDKIKYEQQLQEAKEQEAKLIQENKDKINADFEAYFEDKNNPDYLKLKDATEPEKAKWLKQQELNERYDRKDKGEVSWWGMAKSFATAALENPIAAFSNPLAMTTEVLTDQAQQQTAYNTELEIEEVEQQIKSGNVTNLEELEELKQKQLDLEAKLQGSYRTLNIVDIQGGVRYLDNKYEEKRSKLLSDATKRNASEQELADISSMTKEELEQSLTIEDFESETDYNLFKQRQEDNNLINQLKNKLSQTREIAEQRGEMLENIDLYSKTEYEALTSAQKSIFDYNDPMNEEFKLVVDSIAQRLGGDYTGEQIANDIAKSTDKRKKINSYNNLLEKDLEDKYIDQINKDYDVSKNWFTGGYEVKIDADDEATVFQGKQLIAKPTKGLIERSQKALGNTEVFIQSKGKTVEVDGQQVSAQQNIQNQAFQNLISNDATIKAMMNKFANEAKPKLKAYMKELDTQFDFSKKEDVLKANELLAQKQKELTLDRLYADPMFKQISTDYGMAIDNASRNLETEFARKDSWFLNSVDAVDEATKYIPIVNIVDEVVEGFVSGTTGMGVSIADKAWGSIAGNRYRANKEKAKVLNDQLKSEDISEDDLVYFSNGKYVKWTEESNINKGKAKKASDLLSRLEKDEQYWQDEVVEQIEDMTESEEWLANFRQADFDDGISFADAALTVGQSLPHIATAGLGAMTGNPVLAYLGTAAMFAQMYGDNYWSAIEKNLDRRGLSKEKLKQENPDKSDAEIDQLYKEAASANLMSGEGANMFHSAAMAAVQTGLETYGAQQVIGGTQKALAGKLTGGQLNIGNLFKTSFDDTGKWLLRGAIEKGGNALEEFGTEFMQEIVGQMATAQQAGLESTALIDMNAALQSGIGGALTGFFLPFSGSVINTTNTILTQTANDISLKYRPESAMSKSYQISNAWYEQTKNDLDNEYKDQMDNPDKAQEYKQKLAAISNSYNASIKLGLLGKGKDNFTKNMTEANRKSLLDDYVKIEEIQNKIEGLDKDDPQVKVLKEELSEVQERASETIKAEKTTERVTKILKDAGKANEIVVIDDLSAEEKRAIRKNQKFGDRTTGIFGDDGKIYIDKDLSAKLKSGNTAAHELLHKVMFNTLYDVDAEGNIKGKNVAKGLVNALDGYLDQLDPENTRGGQEFQARLNAYKKQPGTIQAEEKLMLFADAVENGDIQFNESLFTRIGDVFRRFLQDIGVRDVKFNSGRDVYNFIKDYNAAIKKGKLGDALTNVMEKGAKVGKDIERIADEEQLGVVRRSEASYDQTQRLFQDEDFDVDNRFDQKRALVAAQPVIEATTQRLWRPGSLLTRNEFKTALENEYVQALTEYDADRDVGQNPGKSISNKFNLRAGRIARENLGKGEAQSIDRAEARQVEDVTEQRDFDQPSAKQDLGRRKVYPTSLKAVEETITPEAREELKTNLKEDILRDVNQVQDPETVAKRIIKSTQDKSVYQRMRSLIGKFGSDTYNKFVDDVVDQGLVKSMPASTIKRRLGRKANVDAGLIDYQQIGTTKTIKGKSRFAKPVYRINKVDNTKLKEYYKAGEKRSQSLFSMLTEGLHVESMQELKADKAFMDKLGEILSFKGSNLTAVQFMDSLENSLDQRTKEDVSLDVVRASEALTTKKRKRVLDAKKLQAAMQTPGIDALVKSENLGDVTVGKRNRKARVESALNSITNGKIPSRLFRLLKLSNFGRNYAYGIIKDGKFVRVNKKDGGKKYFDTKTGWVLENSKEYNQATKDGTFIPARGSLYYGAKDPNYITALKAAEENDAAYDKNAFKNVKRITIKSGERLTAERKKQLANQERINMQALDDFYSILDKGVKNNTISLADASLFISQAYQGTTGLIKIAAPFVATSDKFTRAKTGKQVLRKEAYIEEHSPPASAVGAAMIWGLKNNQAKAVMQGIKDNFIQIQLSTASDRKLDLAKLDKTIPEGMSILTPNVGYLRLAAAGINLNTITDLKTGKSAANIVGLVIPNSEFSNPSAVNYQNRLMVDMALNPELTLEDAKARLKASIPVQSAKNLNVIKANTDLNSEMFSQDRTADQTKNTMLNSEETIRRSVAYDKPTKGISVFDFDDTLAKTKEKVIVNNADGTTTEISASEFARTADALTEAGATFDFSNFDQVAKGTAEGPLADLARKRQGKFGSGDIFVLTARPNAAGPSIKAFLDSIGINIPLQNITGLEDGSPQAKADWILNKTAEGYNDFYFADDSEMNVAAVQAILDVADVKSDVQIARASQAVDMDLEFNKQIEEVTGKEAFKEYSSVRAALEGKQKDKGPIKRLIKQLTITPSADDFMGLMYAFIGKGEQGNKHLKFIKDNLVDPYNKAEQSLLTAKVNVSNDFAALRNKFPSLKSNKFSLKNPLLQPIGVGPYTKSQAVRVYNWAKQGMDIPGMSQRDVNALVKAVEADPELSVFADELALINKNQQYPAPTANWLGGNIKQDILNGLDIEFRSKLMAEFNANSDIIFSEKNLNKIEALYGTKFREAVEDSLRRMKAGSNRPVYIGGGSRIVNEMLDWLNSSVGAVMFLNMKSGILQMISNINFINWGDNNMFKAARAYASKEYFPTVLKLMNSDYLVNRRDGLKINVNEAELADRGRRGGIQGVISYLLDKGFVITRIMDTLAIATGGATFFINRKAALQNRINPETGKLYTEAEAESQAFDDFYAIAEETQQSSNPSKISQQQASMAGRLLLSFQNVTMQYNRKAKKAILDLVNRRKRPGMTQRESDLSNMSNIVYYLGVQNLVFNSLQQALFAMAFEEEDEKEKEKAANIINGMADSILFGLGFGGAIISTVKNVGMKLYDESERKSPQYEDALWDLFDVSPVIDSKIRKLRTAAKTFQWNMKEIKKRGYSIDNPAYLAISQIISATTNLPVDRVLQKLNNLRQATDEEVRTYQRIAMLLGWSGWMFGQPYWGRQSTINKEAKEEEQLKEKYKNDVRKFKNMGFTKRVPLSGPNSGKPSGELGVDYIAIERPDGVIQYYKKP